MPLAKPKPAKAPSDLPVRTVAALYVEPNGPYAGLDGVEVWDEARDARTYGGPHPVVAHPPCARWGRYWGGNSTQWPRLVKGDDGGCFEAALASVHKFGGILEHPEASHAWKAFGLNKPPKSGVWVNADFDGGWTCCVEQGNYGHRARKATWLYAYGIDVPSLTWGKSEAKIKLEDRYHTEQERRRAVKTGACQRLSHRERGRTPEPFRDLLLSMARSVR